MKNRLFLLLIVLPLLAACGPIWGQMMRLQEGLKSLEVKEGELGVLRPGARIVVLGPFAKAAGAFEICRGDDAAAFAEQLTRHGFVAELSLAKEGPDPRQRVALLAGKSPDVLQKELGLAGPPELLLSGTLLARDMTVAPARGVVLDEAFRLEFSDASGKRRLVVEAAVRELAGKGISRVIEELARRRKEVPAGTP